MGKSITFTMTNSTELIILSAKDCWDDYIKRFSTLDVYHSKEYTILFSKIQDGIPEAAYFENKDGKVFYPFIKRKIKLKENFFDIITPYGYGGPVVEGKERVMEEFYKYFKEYCFTHNIVSETVTLHPLLSNNDSIKHIMKSDYIRRTIAIDLSYPIEEIRKKYSSNNRRNIRKALKEGVSVSISNVEADIEKFIELYYETMDRNHASSFYYFERFYFYQQMKETPLSKSVLLLAKHQDKVVGGIILLIGKDFAHYHLGASKTEYLSLRANNLLFDAMIEHAKSLGANILHLGGGYGDDDNLFRFKSSFTNQEFYEYYLGKHIINEKVYGELAKMVGVPEQDNTYFPIYRVK